MNKKIAVLISLFLWGGKKESKNPKKRGLK